MSTTENTSAEKKSYILVPATVVETEESRKGKKKNHRNNRLPYGARVVEGGYIYNDVFYTDFTSDFGRKMIKNSIMPNLEFIFSDKYLNADKFLRNYMDVEGYFPISLLLFIPIIQTSGADVELLAESLKESTFADVDMSRLTVRVKNDWEKWILPNAEGGKGVPRYVVIGEGDIVSK